MPPKSPQYNSVLMVRGVSGGVLNLALKPKQRSHRNVLKPFLPNENWAKTNYAETVLGRNKQEPVRFFFLTVNCPTAKNPRAPREAPVSRTAACPVGVVFPVAT